MRELWENTAIGMNENNWGRFIEALAPELTVSLPGRDGSGTKDVVGKKLSREHFVTRVKNKFDGYNPDAGKLVATDANGKLRMDFSEIIPGTLARATMVAGSEMTR